LDKGESLGEAGKDDNKLLFLVGVEETELEETDFTGEASLGSTLLFLTSLGFGNLLSEEERIGFALLVSVDDLTKESLLFGGASCAPLCIFSLRLIR
jgi:hypothetical protein